MSCGEAAGERNRFPAFFRNRLTGPRAQQRLHRVRERPWRIASDPLCEVGCPDAVRGFDYDYIGILWLNDLAWRGHRWRVDPNAVEETGFMDLVRAARREAQRGAEGPATAQLLQRVTQAYRVLFTRALKGVYVWAPDAETRAHLAAAIEWA